MKKVTALVAWIGVILIIVGTVQALDRVRWVSRSGQEVDPGDTYTPQNKWVTAGTITVAESALSTSNRTTTYTDALAATKTVSIEWPDGTTVGGMRFITDDDADAWVINIYRRCFKDTYWTPHSTCTLTGGAQVHGSTDVFVDSNVPSNRQSWADWEVTSSAADCISEYWGDTYGDAEYFIIATTIESGSTLTIQYISKTGARS